MASDNSTEYIPYNQVMATVSMRSAPRFGHSSDFSLLFSENQDDVTDYALGLIFIGAFLCGLFLMWLLIVSILKCIPSTGFLSGKKFTQPTRGMRVRIAFITCATIWIIFTILLVTEGLTNLQDTVTTLSNSNQEIARIATEADRIASTLQSVGDMSRGIRDTLVKNLGNLCPDNSNLEELTGFDVEAEAQTAVDLLQQLDDFVTNDLKEVQEGVQNAKDVTVQIDDGVSTIEVSDWQSLVILIPWVLVPSFMLVGVLMAWCSVTTPIYECLLQWFFLPLLIIMTILSLLLAALVSVAAVGNADFCSGGEEMTPDETVFSILALQGYSPDDMIIQAATFYINQCMQIENDPFAFISTYRDQIEVADVQVTELDSSIEQVGTARLTTLCGRDFSEIDGLTSTMVQNLGDLKSSAGDTISLLQCENLVPIYTNTVYDGTCTYSVRGITWTFASCLVIACMGMLMIMFRSSYLGDEEEDPDALFKESAAMGEPVGDYGQEDTHYDGDGPTIYSSKYSATSGTSTDQDAERANGPAASYAEERETEMSYDQDYENSINQSMASAPRAER